MNQKDKDARAKASREYYQEFGENAQQLIDHEQACRSFVSYLEMHGTEGGQEGSVVEVASILYNLRIFFESMEDYMACAKIKRLTDSMTNPSARFSNQSFLYMVETITGHENNAEVGWELLDSHRMFLFSIERKILETDIDGLTFCILLCNYFYDRGMHDRCALIKLHIDELVREAKEERGQPFGTVDGLWS